MLFLKGQSVSEGIAIGRCLVLTTEEVRIKEAYVTPARVGSEVRRYRKALEATEADIRALRDRAASGHEDIVRIVETSLQFLQDDFLVRAIEEKIVEKYFSAPYAVSVVMAQMADNLQAIDDPVFSSKVNDIQDIEHRLLNHLMGGELDRLDELKRPMVIVADDLSPTQATMLDRENLLGFATERGSWASHTAILARALGIPAIVGVPRVAKAATFGSTVIIDGQSGMVVIDPDIETLERYRIVRRRARRAVETGRQSRDLKAETKDGVVCEILGNIETKDDVARVIDSGGTGIGLFRTEFIFLGQSEPPDEERQYEHYRDAVVSMAPGPVTIRTMDFGGDKFDRHTNSPGEANPFMGERAIRVSFKHEDLFRTQIRAILRAALHGTVRLMFPMIMDLGEFRRARALVERAKLELKRANLRFADNVPIGTMIELPSAALNAGRMAREAEFFSIGTNDLTQFSLGVDRTNHRVSHLFASHHPSVLLLIREVVRGAADSARPICLCGEMAGNPRYTPVLIGLGVRSFSVSPPLIPGVKRMLRSVSLARCRELADRCAVAEDAAAVLNLLDEFNG